MPYGPKPRPAINRFMEKVDRSGECWLWTAATFSNGYGAFRDGPKQRRAHRWAYEHFMGPIPDDAVLMHSCDVKRCVNPAHLTPGTPLENQQDMTRKGRSGQRGMFMKGRGPLTHDLADEIRAIYAGGRITQREIATEYGIGQTMVSLIVSDQRWVRRPA